MAEEREQEEATAQITAPGLGSDLIWKPTAEVFTQIGRNIQESLFGLLNRPLPGTGKEVPSDFAVGRKPVFVGPPAPRQVGEPLPPQQRRLEFFRGLFVQEYNRAEQAARQREFTSIPLGYSPSMYEVVTRPVFSEVQTPEGVVRTQTGEETVYRLKDWYKTPLEEAAMSIARMSPAQARAALDDPQQRLLATPAGRRQLQQMSGEDDRYVSMDPTVTSGPSKILTQEDAIDIISRMGTDELNALKDNLIRVGALDANDAGTSLYADRTAGTYQAFADVVALAQGNARTWHSLLAEAIDKNVVLFESKKSGGDQPKQLVRLTSAEDLGAVFGQTALRTIGRRLTDEETQFMVTTYQDMERSFWQQANVGGEVMEPPSAETFAETRIPQQMGTEYDVFQMGNVLDQFRAVMAGEL